MSTRDDLYRALLKSTKDPILLVHDGRIAEASEKALSLLGRAREEMLGEPLSAFSPAVQTDDNLTAEVLQQKVAAAGARDAERFDWEYTLKDGRTVVLRTMLQQLDMEGQRYFTLHLQENGDGAGNASKSQEEEAADYRTVFEYIQDGYYEVDLAGNHTYANLSVCETLGYTQTELVGMNYREYMDEANAAQTFQAFNSVFRTGKPVKSFDHVVITKDGTRRHVQTSVTLLQDHDGQPVGFRGVVRDVTDQKKQTGLLRDANERLERKVAERTDALAKANAELRAQIAEREQADAEIRRNHESQATLSALLQLSLENLSLEQQLDRALDLILSIPWLSTLPTGSIFLVGDEPGVLELVAERGLGKPLLTKCARVRFGQCLCGQAAESGEIIFAGCLDERHDIRYEGIADHGHYNVPIRLDDVVIGVINLYLEAGHKRDIYEITFLEAVASTLASLVKRKRVEGQLGQLLEHRRRQVRLSTQIAQEIAGAADLEDLYQRVVTQVKEQFNYYYAQLLRYDPALDTVALAVGYGEAGEKMLAMHHSIPMGVGLIGTAAAAGRSLLRRDVSKDPTWQPNPLLPRTKGELTVPIKIGETVLGVLDVQSDKTDALTEEDQLLLEGLCGQIAIAIESTRLRQEMESQLQELYDLHRYMSREGWESYQEKATGRAMGYQFGHMGVQPFSSERWPSGDRQDQDGLVVSGNGASHGGSIASGSNAVAKPLLVRGEKFGTLGIIDDPEHPLSAEEQELLAAISSQVAEALEIARLFEQTQESLAEQERLASELETVAQVSTAASTVLDIDTLLQSLVDLAKSSFDLYHAHVYLWDDVTGKLVLRAGAGSVGRLMVLEGREIDINARSLVARAARDREGFFENDVHKATDFLPHPLLPKTRSELAVPMIVADTLIGVFDIQSDVPDGFAAKDLGIHTTLAAQIAVAVQNARLYSEQVETAAKLRQVDQLKSEFLASMSHELRTPLNSIIGFADVLLEGLDGELNDRMEEDVRLIRESGAHLRALIGDILDMTKIEAGRMELRYEEVDVRQLAQDIVSTAGPLAKEKSLDLYLNMATDVKTVDADRTRLRQVLWNIVGNAIKFTEKGYVTLSMQMKDDDLLVSVRDTGIGIRPENLSVVFEQFRQVDGSLNRTAGGTGLGMPITKNLVDLHSGRIWVESVFGQGSTFWFTIPRFRRANRLQVTRPLPALDEMY